MIVCVSCICRFKREVGGGGGFFFFQAEDGIRDHCVTGVQTCALPICIVSTGAAATAPDIGNNNLEIRIQDNTGTTLLTKPLDIIYIPLSNMTWK